MKQLEVDQNSKKALNIKLLLPHFIAVLIFLFVAVIFCRPALDSSLTLKQSDISSWQGMSHQSMEYKEQHGHYPLWITNMFCGMPGYQVAMDGSWSPLAIIDQTIQLHLPQPINFFFLACICFYFLYLVKQMGFFDEDFAKSFSYDSKQRMLFDPGK